MRAAPGGPGACTSDAEGAMRRGLAWAAVGLLAAGVAAAGGPGAGFVDLFNGKDLAGLVTSTTARTPGRGATARW